MNIGLVLSGGMAKGAYQIGALKALAEFVPFSEIKHISCSSVGVLNGYAFATENLDKVEKMWRSLCRNKKNLFITQVIRSGLLQQNIKNLPNPDKKPHAHFYCSLLDWTNKNLVYKDLSTIDTKLSTQYLKASVAMPIYNQAVEIDGISYFDGAMVDNIPIFPLFNKDLDYIICIYFDDVAYRFESISFDNKIIKITFPSNHMLKQAVLINQKSIEDMIKRGYKRTLRVLGMVFGEGYDNLEYIYRAIAIMNQNTPQSSMRITSDAIVTNLNKLTQRLAKRKFL